VQPREIVNERKKSNKAVLEGYNLFLRLLLFLLFVLFVRQNEMGREFF
jgi:hypothetical protein